MKVLKHCAVVLFFLVASAALIFADNSGKHPAYLHALSNLRDARAHLDRLTTSDRLEDQAAHAIGEIDDAISEIQCAAMDDGKDVHDHPPIDENLEKKVCYHKALERLDRAHHEVAETEDDQFAHSHRALQHIDAAHNVVDGLIIQASAD